MRINDKTAKWVRQVKEVARHPSYDIQADKTQPEYRKAAAKKFVDKYGFRHEDTWNLDYAFACWIAPRLAYLRDNHTGYPSSLIENFDKNGNPADDKGDEKWVAILDEMVDGFLMYITDEDSILDLEEEKRKKVKRSLELFREYFFDLWD